MTVSLLWLDVFQKYARDVLLWWWLHRDSFSVDKWVHCDSLSFPRRFFDMFHPSTDASHIVGSANPCRQKRRSKLRFWIEPTCSSPCFSCRNVVLLCHRFASWWSRCRLKSKFWLPRKILMGSWIIQRWFKVFFLEKENFTKIFPFDRVDGSFD